MPRLPGTFSGIFCGTLLNLNWLCTKASQTFSETSHTFSGTFSRTCSETLLNLTWLCPKASQASSGTHWTWLGFAPRLPGTFFGTFSGTLSVEPDLALHQDLLWEPSGWPGCTKASQTFSGTFSGTASNLTRLFAKASNLLRNPVEPDLALHQNLLRNLFLEPCSTWPLHQSFPDLLRNRLRNPVEPNLALHQKASRNPVEPDPALHQSLWQALHQSLPDLLRNFLRNLAWLCTRASQTFSGKLRDDLAAPKLPRPSPEPSPEPCWTWPGSAPKPPDLLRNLLRNLLRAFSGTFSGTFFGTLLGLTKAFWNLPRNLLRDLLRTPVEPELALHQSLSDLPPSPSREPSEPSPEPGWTWPGACTSAHQSYSGLKTQLAYAVGEKGNKRLEAKTQTRFDNANE